MSRRGTNKSAQGNPPWVPDATPWGSYDHARLGAWFRRDASPQTSVASPILRNDRTAVRG